MAKDKNILGRVYGGWNPYVWYWYYLSKFIYHRIKSHKFDDLFLIIIIIIYLWDWFYF